MTYAEFIQKHNLQFEFKKLMYRPLEANDDWGSNASHFQYRIFIPTSGKEIRGIYSQGSGIKYLPRLANILESLIVDIRDFIDTTPDFSDWCSTYGFSDDSMKAHRTYLACQQEYNDLLKMFSKAELSELAEIES